MQKGDVEYTVIDARQWLRLQTEGDSNDLSDSQSIVERFIRTRSASVQDMMDFDKFGVMLESTCTFGGSAATGGMVNATTGTLYARFGRFSEALCEIVRWSPGGG